MNFGDQVIFTENNKQFKATVLSARVLDHHLGANDEPLLQLGFFAPVLAPDGKTEVNVIGTARQNELVQFRADVAHESHEFGAAAAEAKLAGIYPGGRWREAVEPDTPLFVPAVVFSSKEGITTEPPALQSGEAVTITSATGAITEIPRVESAAEETKPATPESEEPPPTVN